MITYIQILSDGFGAGDKERRLMREMIDDGYVDRWMIGR